ncbi:MAG: PKD domain-containing protein [Ginsengibacter sp.]
MKKLFLILSLFFSSLITFATHTKGGWIYYEYLGPGTSDPSKIKYKIVLKIYMICNATYPGQLDDQVNFTYFDGGNYSFIENRIVQLKEAPNVSNCTLQQCNPCVLNIPSICYKIATYEDVVELSPTATGYTIAYQRCCRISGIVNIANSNSLGDTWTVSIPGNATLASAPYNSSPQFDANDTAIVCADNAFTFNFSATDKEKDSLVYSFAPAFSGGTSGNPSPGTAIYPFNNVPYSFPFSATQPLGPLVSIDPVTGIVSGTAPTSGVYVLTAIAKEYRNGVYVGEGRKSLHIQVADCFPIKATLNPQYITCDGFSLAFNNNTPNSNIQNYYWEFDDPSSGINNSSTSSTPLHVFSDTGVYKIKMVVNRGLPCSDSTVSVVKVYPGFSPGFIFSGQCINVPIKFNDTSRTIYGNVDKWFWNFGDGTTLADTTHLQNPSYAFATPGTYTVNLTVSNSKGCTKTVSSPVTIIANPTLSVSFKDSLYCGKDTIQLKASSTSAGTFSWTPNAKLLNANSATPLAFPNAITKYTVTVDAGGCVSSDSVWLRPAFDLAATITASAQNICEDDTVSLKGTANHSPASFTWLPTTFISSLSGSSVNVYPKNNATYLLQAKWGDHCFASTSTTINVKKLAIPNAGIDTAFCKNNSVTLNAGGGDNYQWRPAAGLSNVNIPNPIANPNVTTNYIVSVGVTGCAKRREDTVMVLKRDLPVIKITNDTLVCSIDTLQLNASATNTNIYSWSPSYNISNNMVASPKVSPKANTTYFLQVTDIYKCINTDSVQVTVKQFVSVNAGNDTTICKGDAITINTTSDALHYLWTPSNTLNNDSIKKPIATPLVNTTYKVIGNIGTCQSTDEVLVKVVPYPVANAGKDQALCFDSSAQLTATGGKSYLWSPGDFLSDSTIANPIAHPDHDMNYVVSVKDNLGCPKAVKDTVFIKVYPRVVANAGMDTSIVIYQPLQLNGTGGSHYVWSPSLGLNNANIANPVAILKESQQYILTASNDANCKATDTINITVYKVKAGIYVPNAFTPNGDGLNDVLRAIPLGIKTFIGFNIYDRFGHIVFSTKDPSRGWDGTFKGKALDGDIFVWTVEAIDFENNKLNQKGSVMLVR